MKQINHQISSVYLDPDCIYEFLGRFYTTPKYSNANITLSFVESGLLTRHDSSESKEYYLIEYYQNTKKVDVYLLETELEILIVQQRFVTKEIEE